jgi:hypothetical protein
LLRSRCERVVVELHDSSTDLDARARQPIFEPFFTLHRAGSAAGLGLAIARQALQLAAARDRRPTPDAFRAAERVGVPRPRLGTCEVVLSKR